jgi:opacity protein-like surface antigen
MRSRVITVIAIIVLAAAPSFAQSVRGFVTGAGGFAVSPETTSGDWLGEAGVRVAPNLFVFGNLGQFHNLQPSQVQPAIDATTAMVSGSGLTVTGSGRVPATYALGGVRMEIPTRSRFAPYVFGGFGWAHVAPTATFTYTSGPLPDNSTPAVGDDVTTQLETAGDFGVPASQNKPMYSLGGGIEIPVARHWAIDAGYRFSRISTDTPVHAQGMTFGFGYRF